MFHAMMGVNDSHFRISTLRHSGLILDSYQREILKMFKSVALPQGGAPCNTGKGNISQPARGEKSTYISKRLEFIVSYGLAEPHATVAASNLHHRSSTGSRKSVLAHANIDVKVGVY